MSPATAQAATGPFPSPSAPVFPVHKHRPRGAELTKAPGAAGLGATLAPWARPLPTHRGHEGVKNNPGNVGHHGSRAGDQVPLRAGCQAIVCGSLQVSSAFAKLCE